METSKIAVDIVLIPPINILQLAIELNRGFPDTVKEDYVLDAKVCIPHITLLMGLISQDQLAEVSEKLENIVKNFFTLNLRAIKVTASPIPDGKMFSSLVIGKSANLQKLHETILEKMTPFFSWDGVNKEMFHSPPPVRALSSYWVERFEEKSSRENYRPHISLGFGKMEKDFVPMQFTASRLALCHLGNYCTCRDILSSFPLKVRGIEGVTRT